MCVFVRAIAGVLTVRSPNVIMFWTETITTVVVVGNVMTMHMTIIPIVEYFHCVRVGTLMALRPPP